MERDATTNVQLKFRVKEHLRASLDRAATHRGVSLNAEIVRRLERSFERGGAVIDGIMVINALNAALEGLLPLQEALVSKGLKDEALALIKHQDGLRRLAHTVFAHDTTAQPVVALRTEQDQ